MCNFVLYKTFEESLRGRREIQVLKPTLKGPILNIFITILGTTRVLKDTEPMKAGYLFLNKIDYCDISR